jgi:hypothetical protein
MAHPLDRRGNAAPAAENTRPGGVLEPSERIRGVMSVSNAVWNQCDAVVNHFLMKANLICLVGLNLESARTLSETDA